MSENNTLAHRPATEAIQFDENIISSIVINGDLSKLNQVQKVQYYRSFCERLGLDPMSQPFKLLRLNGKEVLYCDRSGAQQLNKIHKVSHEIKARENIAGCYVVTCRATTPDGRHTESIGAVPIENLRDEALCNAMMKAETKSKRRATLDLLGLGILDETETDSIPGAVKADATSDGQGGAFVGAGKMPDPDKRPDNKKVSGFKKSYGTREELFGMVDLANDVKDIANLYYINAELIEGDAELKAAFTAKKNDLFGKGQGLQGGAPAAQ